MITLQNPNKQRRHHKGENFKNLAFSTELEINLMIGAYFQILLNVGVFTRRNSAVVSSSG